MNVLIRNRKIYEQVFYDNEGHFEDIAKKQLAEVFDEFIVLDFKPLVLGDDGVRRRPDLALIHRRYLMWVVVEVELEHHSLDHHVFPQMQALASGAYELAHADYLAQKCSKIDLERAKDLVTYIPPQVMTLVNSRRVLEKGWEILESDLRVRLTFLETYRSEIGDSIFCLSGYIPQIKSERIAGAKTHRMINALVCRNPDSIPVAASATLRMYVEGRPIDWQVLKTADSALLIPRPSFTLRRDRNYEILRAENGNMLLRML